MISDPDEYDDEYEDYLSKEIKLWVEDYQNGNIHGMQVASALLEAKGHYIKFRKKIERKP